MKYLNSLPLVSIVIPVYNVESLIERCVLSVLNQTYGNLQIVLVDDGSTDTSGSICERLAMKDARVEVIHTTNGGLSAARNAGMKLARGAWVAFVDSDDMIGESHIENLLNAVEKRRGKVVVAVTGSNPVSIADSHIKSAARCPLSFKVLDATEAIAVSVTEKAAFASHAWGKLYPEEVFPLLEYPVGRYFEDQFVTYKIFLAADCIVYEDADDYGYTVDRDASISNSSYLHRLDYLSAIRLMRDDLRRKLPETLDAVSLRYCATLASSVAIATMDSDPEVFGRVYSELVDARHDALSMRKLPFKSRAVYLLSYLGKETTRRSLSSFARRMTKETKAEEESPKG